MALTLIFGSFPACAQQQGQSDTINVEGLSAERTGAVIAKVAEPGAGGVIPKFRDWLCVTVVNLKPDYGRLLSERIAEVAREAGVRVRSGRCAPNLLVVAPSDPDAFAAALTRERPMLFGDPRRGMAPASLLAALRKPRAVRWFSVVVSQGRKGGMWRLEAAARNEKAGTYVIVDVTKLDGITWNQLGDYIALVAFANPRMDTAYPSGTTILSLFADREAGKSLVAGRTAFDRALLSAVYHVDEGLSATLQRDRIVHDVELHRAASDVKSQQPAR